MIYEMSKAVAATLASRKFPVKMIYGPERLPSNARTHVIRFERDRDASDSVVGVRGALRNPRKVLGRELAAAATIWARSSLESAHHGDHERLCEQLVDGLLIAMSEWYRVHGHAGSAIDYITDSRYLNPKDLGEEFEQWPGVVYRIKFRVPRAVHVLTYKGDALPEGSFAFVGSVAIVTHGDDPPETVQMVDQGDTVVVG